MSAPAPPGLAPGLLREHLTYVDAHQDAGGRPDIGIMESR